MDMRRTAQTATQTSPQTAGRRDAAIFARSLIEQGATMRDVVAAGGLRGFAPDDLFPKVAA